MNIRRALTATAATALLAPAALLTAPTAQATGTPTPVPTTSTPAPPSPTPTPTTTSTTTPTPSQTPSGTPATPGATPTRPPDAEPTHDPCRRQTSGTDAVTTRMSAPPGDVVAGSDWVGLSYLTRNTSGVVLDTVDNYLTVTPTGKAARTAAPHLTLQWLDSGGWSTVDAASGYVTTYVDLMIGETLAKPMRMKVDVGTPPGSYTFTLTAGYKDENGQCGFTEPVTYRFEVLPAQGGEDGPGGPGDGHATPTAAPDTPRPAPEHHPAAGNLAATGVSPALPVLALSSGVAVLAGAGVVFAVRRRRRDGGDA